MKVLQYLNFDSVDHIMLCGHCGAKIKANTLICNKCGDVPDQWGEWDTIDFVIPYLLKIHKNNSSKYNTMFKPSDNKHFMLTQICNISLWTALNLMMFKENFHKSSSPLVVFLKDKNIINDEEVLIRFTLNQVLYNKSSCLSNFLFCTEVFLQSVNEVLKNPFEGKGYANLAKHVLRELNLNDAKLENYNTLYIPAIIRNSMHSEGIYTDNDYNGKINKILFKFKKGHPTGYATWKHICFFLENYFEVIDKILSTHRIKNAELSRSSEGFEIDLYEEIRKIKPRKN